MDLNFVKDQKNSLWMMKDNAECKDIKIWNWVDVVLVKD